MDRNLHPPGGRCGWHSSSALRRRPRQILSSAHELGPIPEPAGRQDLGGFSHPFMLVVGVIEMCVGLMIITKWTKLGAYIASIWLVLIALT